MSTKFWSDPRLDPKRSYRFVVYVDNLPPFIAKTCTKPTFQVGVSKHKYLNHTFKFPTTVECQDITIKFADPAGGDGSDVTNEFVKRLQGAGYTYPTDPTQLSTVGRDKAVLALGQVTVQQINSDGEPVEEWKLHNAFVSNVTFGELSYESDAMVEISVTVVYDYAKISVQ